MSFTKMAPRWRLATVLDKFPEFTFVDIMYRQTHQHEFYVRIFPHELLCAWMPIRLPRKTSSLTRIFTHSLHSKKQIVILHVLVAEPGYGDKCPDLWKTRSLILYCPFVGVWFWFAVYILRFLCVVCNNSDSLGPSHDALDLLTSAEQEEWNTGGSWGQYSTQV